MIYCVEDDNSIRDLMIYTLTIAGFEAKGFADSASFWKEMQTGRPELILLDIMLPGEDGISILKKLRSSPTTAALPVIMATAKGSEYDRVIGLDLGADDYLCKPFGMMEMVSRIRAVLRRTSMSEHKNYLSYGAITMDQSRHVVLVDGREVSLTLKEYDLLKLLLEHTGLVFTRDQLLSPSSARAARLSALSAESATGSDSIERAGIISCGAKYSVPSGSFFSPL